MAAGSGDAGQLLAEALGQRPGYQNTATLKEPYRIEGKKTTGLEITEQLRSGRRSGHSPSRNPRAMLAAALEAPAYRWPLPGKITTRPPGISAAVRRNKSLE